MSGAKPMRVHILDKEYLVACPEDEREALFASAELLTSKMKEIRDSGKIVGADRIAVIDHGLIQALDSPAGLKAMVGGDLVTVGAADLDAAVMEIRFLRTYFRNR